MDVHIYNAQTTKRNTYNALEKTEEYRKLFEKIDCAVKHAKLQVILDDEMSETLKNYLTERGYYVNEDYTGHKPRVWISWQ